MAPLLQAQVFDESEESVIATAMFLGLQALALEPGQAFQLVAEFDCQVHEPVIAMNGAGSTSSMGSGETQVTLQFIKKWPSDLNADVGVISVEVQGSQTILKELAYDSDYVPDNPDAPQASIILGDAVRSYILEPSDEVRGEWSYHEEGLLIHGATESLEGKCRLKPTRV